MTGLISLITNYNDKFPFDECDNTLTKASRLFILFSTGIQAYSAGTGNVAYVRKDTRIVHSRIHVISMPFRRQRQP